MKIDMEERLECVILRISGDMRLWREADIDQDIVRALPWELGTPGSAMILNLSGLSHIDSRGITALVRLLVECARRSLHLSIVLPSGPAGDAIKRTRILAHWPQFESEEQTLLELHLRHLAATG